MAHLFIKASGGDSNEGVEKISSVEKTLIPNDAS